MECEASKGMLVADSVVACQEVVYEGAGACPRPLARPGRPRIVVGLG